VGLRLHKQHQSLCKDRMLCPGVVVRAVYICAVVVFPAPAARRQAEGQLPHPLCHSVYPLPASLQRAYIPSPPPPTLAGFGGKLYLVDGLYMYYLDFVCAKLCMCSVSVGPRLLLNSTCLCG
jgi:hypothetical protein